MDNTLTTELFHIVSISLDISISISIVSLSLYIFLLKKYARTDRKTRISRCGSSRLSSKGGSRARAGRAAAWVQPICCLLYLWSKSVTTQERRLNRPASAQFLRD